MKLFNAKVGPNFFGMFTNGCCYEFIPGRSLEPYELGDQILSRLIATELGKWHFVVPYSKTDKPSLFRTIRGYISKRPTKFEKEDKQKILNIIHVDHLINEFEMYAKLVEHISPTICFCHNDLLCGNVLYNKEKEHVTFIDYEYAATNYQIYDLSNHLCEYSGFEFDYKKKSSY